MRFPFLFQSRDHEEHSSVFPPSRPLWGRGVGGEGVAFLPSVPHGRSSDTKRWTSVIAALVESSAGEPAFHRPNAPPPPRAQGCLVGKSASASLSRTAPRLTTRSPA